MAGIKYFENKLFQQEGFGETYIEKTKGTTIQNTKIGRNNKETYCHMKNGLISDKYFHKWNSFHFLNFHHSETEKGVLKDSEPKERKEPTVPQISQEQKQDKIIQHANKYNVGVLIVTLILGLGQLSLLLFLLIKFQPLNSGR